RRVPAAPGLGRAVQVHARRGAPGVRVGPLRPGRLPAHLRRVPARRPRARPRRAPQTMTAALDRVAGAGLLLPWLITGYYWLHALGRPGWWPLLLVPLAAVGYRVFRTPASAPDAPAAPQPGRPWAAAGLLALLLVPPLAHSASVAWHLGRRPRATDFPHPTGA